MLQAYNYILKVCTNTLYYISILNESWKHPNKPIEKLGQVFYRIYSFHAPTLYYTQFSTYNIQYTQYLTWKIIYSFLIGVKTGCI